MGDLGSHSKRLASEREGSPPSTVCGGSVDNLSLTSTAHSSSSSSDLSALRTTWPLPKPGISFGGPGFLPSKSEERSSKRHCTGLGPAAPPDPPAIGLPTPAETPTHTPPASPTIGEAPTLVAPATTPSLPPPLPPPSPAPAPLFTRPLKPSLSEMAARADRDEWRQRCDDLYNSLDLFSDDLFSDDPFNSDGPFYGDDPYDSDDSDEGALNYHPSPIATLGVMDIPWPTQIPNRSNRSILNRLTLDDVNPTNVKAFLWALANDEGEDERRVVTDALRYFDPDRFDDKVLPRVYEGHRRLVQDGVERVWCILTDLLAHLDTPERKSPVRSKSAPTATGRRRSSPSPSTPSLTASSVHQPLSRVV